MQVNTQLSHTDRDITVAVPEKHFLRWLHEESKITRSGFRYDLAKECLPYVTALLMLVFTGLFYPTALIGVGPTLIGWIVYALKKRTERKSGYDN